MKPRNGHSFWSVVAGIMTETGFTIGLTFSLCLLAYLVAAMTR
ncbi:MAG: hypothetical protein ACM3WU_08330 [Bacillota bacterium]